MSFTRVVIKDESWIVKAMENLAARRRDLGNGTRLILDENWDLKYQQEEGEENLLSSAGKRSSGNSPFIHLARRKENVLQPAPRKMLFVTAPSVADATRPNHQRKTFDISKHTSKLSQQAPGPRPPTQRPPILATFPRRPQARSNTTPTSSATGKCAEAETEGDLDTTEQRISHALDRSDVLNHPHGTFKSDNIRMLMSALLGTGFLPSERTARGLNDVELHLFLSDMTILRRGSGRGILEIEWNTNELTNQISRLPRELRGFPDLIHAFGDMPSSQVLESFLGRQHRLKGSLSEEEEDVLQGALIYSYGREGRFKKATQLYYRRQQDRPRSQNPHVHMGVACADAFHPNRSAQAIRTFDCLIERNGEKSVATTLLNKLVGIFLEEPLKRQLSEEIRECLNRFEAHSLHMDPLIAQHLLLRCPDWSDDTLSLKKAYRCVLNPNQSVERAYHKALLRFQEDQEAKEVNCQVQVKLPLEQSLTQQGALKRSASIALSEEGADGTEEAEGSTVHCEPSARERSADRYNAKLAELVKAHAPIDAVLGVREEMERNLVVANERTYSLLLTSFATDRDFVGALSVFDEMEARRMTPTCDQYAEVMSGIIAYPMSPTYMARLVYKRIKSRGIQLTARNFTSMMNSYMRERKPEGMQMLMSDMLAQNIEPDREGRLAAIRICLLNESLTALYGLFDALAKTDSLRESECATRAIEVDGGMDQDRPEEMLVRTYAKRGDLLRALAPLKSIVLRNPNRSPLVKMATYEALVSAFESNGGELEKLPPPNPRPESQSSDYLLVQNFLLCAHARWAQKGPSRGSSEVAEVCEPNGSAGLEAVDAPAADAKQRLLDFWEHLECLECCDGVSLSTLCTVVPWKVMLDCLLGKYRATTPMLEDAYATLMRQLLEIGRVEEACQVWEVFKKRTNQCVPKEVETFEVVIQALGRRRQSDEKQAAGELYDRMDQKNLTSAGVAAMINLSKKECAKQVFFSALKWMRPEMDERPYNALMEKALPELDLVQRIFRLMVKNKVVMTGNSFSVLFRAFCRQEKAKDMWEFLASFSEKENSKVPDLALICELWAPHRQLHQQQPRHPRRIRDAIESCLSVDQIEFGESLVKRFAPDEKRRRDPQVAMAMFNLHIQRGDLDQAAWRLEQLPHPEREAYTRLCQEYTQRRQLDRVQRTIEEMLRRRLKMSIDLYNTLIGCHMLCGKCPEAMDVASEVLNDENVAPNGVTYRLATIATKTAGTPAHLDTLMRVQRRLSTN